MSAYNQNLKLLYKRLEGLSEFETIQHPHIISDIIQFKDGGTYTQQKSSNKKTSHLCTECKEMES